MSLKPGFSHSVSILFLKLQHFVDEITSYLREIYRQLFTTRSRDRRWLGKVLEY